MEGSSLECLIFRFKLYFYDKNGSSGCEYYVEDIINANEFSHKLLAWVNKSKLHDKNNDHLGKCCII